jgi:hypothetical protein
MLVIPLARTAFAAPAAKVIPSNMRRLSLSGIVQSTERYSTDFATMSVTASGWGDVTELGRFTVSYQTEVNLLDLSGTESAQFVAANGDRLQARGAGQATEDQTPGIFHVVEIYTITGGTGRFTNASGTLTLKRVVVFATGSTAATLEGYVLIP